MAKSQSKKIGTILGVILIAGGIYGVFFVDWKKDIDVYVANNKEKLLLELR